MQTQHTADILVDKALLVKSCNPGAQNITVTRCANGEIKTSITWPKQADTGCSGTITIVDRKTSGSTHIRWVQTEEPAAVHDKEPIDGEAEAPTRLRRTPSLSALTAVAATEAAFTETDAATVTDVPGYFDGRFVTPEPAAFLCSSVLQTPRKKTYRGPGNLLPHHPAEQSYLTLRSHQPVSPLRTVQIQRWREEVQSEASTPSPKVLRGRAAMMKTTVDPEPAVGSYATTESCDEDDEGGCLGSYHLPSSDTGDVRGKALYIRRYFDEALGEWIGETNMTKRDLEGLSASHHLARAIRAYGVDRELPSD